MMRLTNGKRSFLGIFLQIFCVFTPLAQSATPPAKLAIVIDDIGYHSKEDSAIYALPKEVNVAIIPVAPFAKARATEAYQQKRDILIHMPMQPKSNQPIEDGGIKIGDSEEKIRKLIATSRGQVPYAIGLNNHMGSGVTSDLATMQNVMKVLKEQSLFFLDSKTIGSSMGAKTARQFGVNVLERDIFLDDSNELVDVQKQFNLAISHARKKGVAIVIGHPRKNTVAVLQQHLANLPSDIQLVNIGSLWRNEKVMPEKPFKLLFEQEAATTSVPPYENVPLLRGIPKE